MKKALLLGLALIVAGACSRDEPAAPEPVRYSIDAQRITVSGVSSGAYMAGQLHLAHSHLFGALALIAGGPYYCAQGSVMKGIGPCIKGGDLGLDALRSHAREAAAAGQVDDLANLRDDTVWIFHGTLDNVVDAGVTAAAVEFYSDLVGEDAVSYVDDIAVVHGMPTIASGLACDSFGTPFIQACDYDAAGALLLALYGPLADRVEARGELRRIPQPGADDALMLDEAYLYVPTSCAAGASCGIHVALHGCSQSSAFVGDAFASGAGYNEWAEANRLLVLYPQVGSSKIAPMNPYGCWDWWGYTGADYATRDGSQVAVIKAMLDTLAGITL
jgi:poly(3-hydroxybutyrate) depolymerase